jgi:hypothetical protein
MVHLLLRRTPVVETFYVSLSAPGQIQTANACPTGPRYSLSVAKDFLLLASCN